MQCQWAHSVLSRPLALTVMAHLNATAVCRGFGGDTSNPAIRRRQTRSGMHLQLIRRQTETATPGTTAAVVMPRE